MPEDIAPEREKQIRDFVRERLREADIAHGFDHVQYVVNMARKIALQEGADLKDAGGDIHLLEIGQDAHKSRLSRVFVPVVDDHW